MTEWGQRVLDTVISCADVSFFYKMNVEIEIIRYSGGNSSLAPSLAAIPSPSSSSFRASSSSSSYSLTRWLRSSTLRDKASTEDKAKAEARVSAKTKFKSQARARSRKTKPKVETKSEKTGPSHESSKKSFFDDANDADENRWMPFRCGSSSKIKIDELTAKLAKKLELCVPDLSVYEPPRVQIPDEARVILMYVWMGVFSSLPR